MWCSVNPAIRDPELAELAPAAIAGPGRRRRWRSGRARGRPRRRAARPRVVLFERRPQLGGRARLAGAAARAGALGALHRLAARRGAAAGAELRTGVAATAQDVLAERPDAVVLATGSELRPSAAPPGPVPVIDVDALLEHGAPDGRDAVGAWCSTTRAASSRRPPRSASSPRDSPSRSPPTHPVVGAEIDATQQPFVSPRLALAGVGMSPHLSGRRERRRRRHPAQHLHRAR